MPAAPTVVEAEAPSKPEGPRRAWGEPPRWPAIVALVASLLGLALAASSALDYAHHLDRQLHDVHCSYLPGLSAAEGGDNPCRAAMYSPYAALFRDHYWGGVPIALFAVGAFAFFAAFALYLALAHARAPRRAFQFLGIAGVTPLLASAVMAFITATRLGHFCKTCVGIYVASLALAIAGIAAYLGDQKALKEGRFVSGAADATQLDSPPRRLGGDLLMPAWLLALGVFAIVPALIYTSAIPSYASYVTSCGKLEKPGPGADIAIHPPAPAGAKQAATLFVDPLCPTCKAFDQRLKAEGYLDKLDITLVLFPLDSDCNWMLMKPMHPGACIVSKAIMCSDHKAMQVLEWAYDNQDDLAEAAKRAAGINNVRAMIDARWPGLDACIDSKETGQKLDKTLRYIASKHIPVSTPQVFMGETKLCDEDTDMGLAYAMKRLAPSLEEAR